MVSHVNSKTQASAITTHMWIQLDKNGKLQENSNFISGNFLMNKDAIKKLRDEEDSILSKMDETHYSFKRPHVFVIYVNKTYIQLQTKKVWLGQLVIKYGRKMFIE